MRADIIVILSPGFDEMPSVSEALKHMLVQTFVPDPAVKALGKSVLSRLARRDVVPFDAMFLRPHKNGATGQLRAVVADDAMRLAVALDQNIQLTNHAVAAY